MTQTFDRTETITNDPYTMPIIELNDQATALFETHQKASKSEKKKLKIQYNHLAQIINSRRGFKAVVRIAVAAGLFFMTSCGEEKQEQVGVKIDEYYGTKHPMFADEYFKGLKSGDKLGTTGFVVDTIFIDQTAAIEEIHHVCHWDACTYKGLTLSQFFIMSECEEGSDCFYFDYSHMLYPAKTPYEIDAALYTGMK